MALRALFLGAPGVVSAGIARGWQLAGHTIAAIWYPERLAVTSEFEQDRALARRAPGVSMHGLGERGGVSVRAVPRLMTWSAASSEAGLLNVDVVISALFLDRIPGGFLDAFPKRVFNLHPSLLPAYRGRWPIFNMLWDRKISACGGMTLHFVTPTFDAGALLAQHRVGFPSNCNVSAYYMQLVKSGAALLAENLPLYLEDRLEPAAQDVSEAWQGNQDPRKAKLTAALSTDHIQWLCATIPQVTKLGVEGASDDISIKTFVQTVGPPTGAPPERNGNSITMDALDARVRLSLT
ncbi:MAG: hypothetical protein DCF16_15115 [Alphaproteobacteria bacterium]|nr:MAG: hypothetical protein DCF16_15115 [Alphaproteobacteria bacterium]